jgi:hypothetical protein
MIYCPYRSQKTKEKQTKSWNMSQNYKFFKNIENADENKINP